MQGSSKLRRLGYLTLIILILSMSAATSAQQGSNTPDKIDWSPIWDPTVLSFLSHGDQSVDFDIESDAHPGHLGWDKATGQRLDDPTASMSDLDVESSALAADKLATLDTTRLIYRSGFRQQTTRSLDADWINQVASASVKHANGHVVETPQYGVIQFPLPFDTAARVELERVGVRFYNYVEGGGLYARMPSGALATLRSLSDVDRVLYAGPIPLRARLETALIDKAEAEPEATVNVVLQLFDVPSDAQLAQLAPYLQVESTSLHPALPLLEGHIRAGDALALANLSFVRWLEIEALGRPGNLESTMALGTDVLRKAGGNQTIGTGVRVAIIDSGIANPYHTDLPVSRIADQWEYYPGNDAIANDEDFHGTHLAGTIGGSGTGSTDKWMQGHAPGVQFLIYKMCCASNGSGWPPSAVQNSIIRGAQHGMNIANHSWGGGGYGIYNTYSEIVDRAVLGEYGPPSNQVIISHNYNNLTTAPGTGKNVITVGAVYSGNWGDPLGFDCDNGDRYDWPPAARACFSDYGPIDTDGDGYTRVKPDVMAVGVNVDSTYYKNNIYWHTSGTSMAAPAVSGAIATLLDYYSDSNNWLFNWPETVKAMILANAVDVGGDTSLYGRGLVDIYHTARAQNGIVAPGGFWGNALAATGSIMKFTFDVPANYNYVRAVLTWPDPAGAVEVANDLDLYVYNNSTCSGSPVGLAESSDDTVEFVQINAGPTSGQWCALVKAYSLSSPNQTFGLAVSPVLKQPSLSVSTSVSKAFAAAGEPLYYYTTLTNSGNTAGGSHLRVWIPSGFTLDGARLYTSDGRTHFYAASHLRRHVGYWYISTGAAIAGAPRLVRWEVHANTPINPGSYGFAAYSGFLSAGQLKSSTSPVENTVTVGNIRKVYVPLLIR